MERSDKDKVEVLREALEQIREATFAEFQEEFDPTKPFNPKRHVCPLCRRSGTALYLRTQWAKIQHLAAEALRELELE